MTQATGEYRVRLGDPWQIPLPVVQTHEGEWGEVLGVGPTPAATDAFEQEAHWRDVLVGDTPALKRTHGQIAQAARSDTGVLICGEMGTGKKHVARLIHHGSPRGNGPFVVVDCSSMSGSRMARELLGHAQGKPFDSPPGQPGKMEQAHKGTLFLEEVGELDAHLQREVLRALEERRIQKVGAEGTQPADVRVIAATSHELEPAVADGYFRRDLHTRLTELVVQLPPLRGRKADVELLTTFFIERYSQLSGRTPTPSSPDLLEVLHAYPWPGNVGELEDVVRRLLMRSRGETLTPDLLPARFAPWLGGSHTRRISLDSLIEKKVADFVRAMHDADAGNLYRIVIESVEKPLLQSVLMLTRGNQVRAAALLGINRNTLRKKIRALKIQRHT